MGPEVYVDKLLSQTAVYGYRVVACPRCTKFHPEIKGGGRKWMCLHLIEGCGAAGFIFFETEERAEQMGYSCGLAPMERLGVLKKEMEG
jgi:hypothetical protein